MRDLPLNTLRAFAAVYETGGIRPAARALQVAHSAVSRHLRELEAWFGQPLFQPRSGTRGLAFTAQGEALGRAALTSFRDLETAVAAVREVRRSNSVTVSTTPSFAARWLLPRLAALEAAHPTVELSVIVDQRPVDPADQGADLSIRMGLGPWPGLACEPLMDDALYPVVSPAYWEANGRPRDIGVLVHLRLLHDRDPFASWEAWRKVHGPVALDSRVGPRFTSSDLVLRAATQSLGAALARDRLARDDVGAGTLIRPFGDLQVALPNGYWLVRPEGTEPRAAAVMVMDWLRDEAAKL